MRQKTEDWGRLRRRGAAPQEMLTGKKVQVRLYREKEVRTMLPPVPEMMTFWTHLHSLRQWSLRRRQERLRLRR